MDKQVRLTGLIRQLSEYKEVMDQATYSLSLALMKKEYGFVLKNAEILDRASDEIIDIEKDIARLRIEIEDEAKEELL